MCHRIQITATVAHVGQTRPLIVGTKEFVARLTHRAITLAPMYQRKQYRTHQVASPVIGIALTSEPDVQEVQLDIFDVARPDNRIFVCMTRARCGIHAWHGLPHSSARLPTEDDYRIVEKCGSASCLVRLPVLARLEDICFADPHEWSAQAIIVPAPHVASGRSVQDPNFPMQMLPLLNEPLWSEYEKFYNLLEEGVKCP